MDLKFIDCNCSFGLRKNIQPFMITKKEDVKKELTRLNIVKAITTHSSQREFDVCHGNQRVIDEIKGDNFFYPSMTLIPFSTEEYLNIDETDKFIDDNGIKTISLYPSVHKYSYSSWNMGDVYDYISQKGLPVIISKNDVSPDGMYNILSEFKKMKVIYTDLSYAEDRSVMSLMKKFDNLYIETATYHTLDGIEFVTKKIGAERLVFGSGMPYVSAGASVSRILFAKISDSEKEKIACKNICELIGEDLL